VCDGALRPKHKVFYCLSLFFSFIHVCPFHIAAWLGGERRRWQALASASGCPQLASDAYNGDTPSIPPFSRARVHPPSFATRVQEQAAEQPAEDDDGFITVQHPAMYRDPWSAWVRAKDLCRRRPPRVPRTPRGQQVGQSFSTACVCMLLGPPVCPGALVCRTRLEAWECPCTLGCRHVRVCPCWDVSFSYP
jgi:hypothetical protein